MQPKLDPARPEQPSSGRRFGWALGALVAVAACFGGAGAAQAQPFDPEQVERGLRIFRDVANCKYCHGWDGRSALVEGFPSPPTLVKTILDKDALIEAIACGRPRPGMPRHLEIAWTPEYKCYDMVKEEIGRDYPDVPQRRYLTKAEIEDVAVYVMAFYKAGDMTFENCQRFFAPQGSRVCDEYKK